MSKIVIIGAGTMGLGIAQVFAKAGFHVIVRDVSDEIIDAAKARLKKDLESQIASGKLDELARKEIVHNVKFTVDFAAVSDADLVVEAVFENPDVKKAIFSQLDARCKPETILATNTSSCSITDIASATKRPDKVIGMHFFNPPTVMKLVEIIRGDHTSDETEAFVYDMAKKIAKTPVKVNGGPGFVVNKLLIPMINEAADLLYTGIATAEDIDTAMQLGANHRMGPLTLGDLIGLDVCLAIMDSIYEETRDSKYRASLLLRKMVRAGKLGRKSGEGFYKY